MRPPLRRRPQLEALEAISMPSATAAAPVHALVAADSATPATHHIQLSGEAKGTYSIPMSNPDVGKTYNFLGVRGPLKPLGRVKLTGKVEAPGFIANAQSHGTLVITNPHGSLTLQVTGPAQPGGPPFPSVFNYTITHATGRYKGDTGTGYIVLGLTPNSTPTPTPATTSVQTGHFTMTFLSVPPP